MIKRLKVMTVVGTRPELIRLSRIIPALDKHFEHLLVHTGQNYDPELMRIFFTGMSIREPNYVLDVAQQSKSSAGVIGNIITEVDQLIEMENPDAFLILGDTNSCLSLISAKKRRVPIFHLEAGNRCFDERVPEETNRRIVDHTSDVNLTYSAIAREHLLREGLPPDRVIRIGSPMYEVLSHYLSEIDKSTVLEQLELNKYKYFLVSFHREENVDSERMLSRFVEIMNSLSEIYKMPIVVSTHPRTRNRLDQAGLQISDQVKLLRPLGFIEYNKLQICAKAVLSDSGTISEESSILNFPALNLRETHERQEAMEEGAVMMVGLNKDRVLCGLNILDSQQRGERRNVSLAPEYSVANVSEKVVRIVHSYVDYIKRVVWQQY